MTNTAKRRAGNLAFFMVLSAVLLLFFSGCSPLYPTNPWVDANCFHTVARGITRGQLPYMHLIEQKGPLLYFAHVPSVLLSPNGFFGVYLLQVLLLTLFLAISYRTVCLFKKDCPVWLIALPALFYVSCRAYVWGDSAEELCMPAFALALYDLLRILRKDDFDVEPRTLLINGFLAGCIFWTKFSLLGMHFGWMAFLAIYCIVKKKGFLRAVKMCLLFLAAMAAASVPWIAIYAAKGGLGDLWRVYFLQNTSGYASSGMIPVTVIRGLFGGSIINPCVGISIFSGLLYILWKMLREKKTAVSIALITVVLTAAFFQYAGNRENGYYYLVFIPFAPLVCVPLADLRLLPKRALRIAAVALTCVVLCLSVGLNESIRRIGTPQDSLLQNRFAAQIEKGEDTRLLNFGFLDGGFYLSSGIEPSEPWFCVLLANKSEGKDAQKGYAASGTFDYIVTDKELELDQYECIDSGKETFDYKRKGSTYYLYHRIAPGDGVRRQ